MYIYCYNWLTYEINININVDFIGVKIYLVLMHRWSLTSASVRCAIGPHTCTTHLHPIDFQFLLIKSKANQHIGLHCIFNPKMKQIRASLLVLIIQPIPVRDYMGLYILIMPKLRARSHSLVFIKKNYSLTNELYCIIFE